LQISRDGNKSGVDMYLLGKYIPETVSNADLIAIGQHHGKDRIYYFKNYKQGTHFVVTDKNGNVLEQGKADGLLTQYPVDLKKEFDKSFRVTYKKRGIVSDAPESSLSPTTATESPRALDENLRAPTDALSNSAGGEPSTGQTESFPNHGRDNSNIQNSKKVKKPAAVRPRDAKALPDSRLSPGPSRSNGAWVTKPQAVKDKVGSGTSSATNNIQNPMNGFFDFGDAQRTLNFGGK